MIVQCLGVVTTYVMISQLAMAEAMPSLYFILTSVVVGTGVISNFLNYFGMLPPIIWGFWEDFITVGGLSVLPQVLLLFHFLTFMEHTSLSLNFDPLLVNTNMFAA